MYSQSNSSTVGPRSRQLSWNSGEAIPARADYLEPRAQRMLGTARPFYVIAIPHWLIFLLTAPWPLWWLARHRQQATRRRRGLCAQCGYDVRASPERCPECGTPIPSPWQGEGRVRVEASGPLASGDSPIV